MNYLMIVSDPSIATYAWDCGVRHLFVDLEYMGKQERQGHIDSWKSDHTQETVSLIRNAAPKADLMVRVNPLHGESQTEIDDVIARGADRVMLPMFQTADELEVFFELLDGRAKAVPLFETAKSLENLGDILARVPIEFAHIGLNDLHLDLKLKFMFQPLSMGLIDGPAKLFCDANVTFGIGGIARMGQGLISPVTVLSEHVRLGSTFTILSRSFHGNSTTLQDLRAKMDLAAEMGSLSQAYSELQAQTASVLEKHRLELAAIVAKIVQ